MSKRLLGEKKYNEFMEKINKNLPEDEKVSRKFGFRGEIFGSSPPIFGHRIWIRSP